MNRHRLNHWIDGFTRDRGTYRYRAIHDYDSSISRNPKTICNNNDMEDALIEALDAGMTAEEIADIQLGAIS